jgi:hypothetical protein
MLSVIGKVMAWVFAVTSFVALGLALWTVADQTDYRERQNKLKAEVAKAYADRDAEIGALQQLMLSIMSGSRELPYDPATLEARGAGKAKTVKESYSDIKAQEEENRKLRDEWNRLQVSVTTLINDLRTIRDESQKALEEQRQLREFINPDPQRNPNAKPFRDLAADAVAAKEEAERRTEALTPTLVNEALKLQVLMQRNEELQKRADELKKASEK